MSIEEGRGSRAAVIGRRRRVQGFAVLLMLGAVGLAGCGGDTPEPAQDSNNGAINSNVEPISAVPASEEPATIADVFPEGEGREVVLNNCASCHAVACTAIGQRSDGRWQDLREAHREHVPSLSEEELTRAFAYLSENFGADQPEPNVPPRFLEGGCTPF